MSDNQLISEFVILSLRVEDTGTFFCSAENPAGVARANFTVRVLSQDGDSAVKSSVVQHHNSNSKDSKTSVITADQQEEEMYKVGQANFSTLIFLSKVSTFWSGP